MGGAFPCHRGRLAGFNIPKLTASTWGRGTGELGPGPQVWITCQRLALPLHIFLPSGHHMPAMSSFGRFLKILPESEEPSAFLLHCWVFQAAGGNQLFSLYQTQNMSCRKNVKSFWKMSEVSCAWQGWNSIGHSHVITTSVFVYRAALSSSTWIKSIWAM